MGNAPKWYREVYKQFAKDNPTKADEGTLKTIEKIEDDLSKGDIPYTFSV